MGARETSRRFVAGWRERIRIFVLFTCAIVAVELAHDVYRLFAFAEERAQLRVLDEMVDAAGVAVLKTQLREDSLRGHIEALDEALDSSRDSFAFYDARARDGSLSASAYEVYRARIARYNDQLAVRNAWVARLQRAVSSNRDAEKRYHALAEQIRIIAAEMGEQNYNIPSPVEAAVKSGMR